jgi:4'-phosphopantetheinyl transferase
MTSSVSLPAGHFELADRTVRVHAVRLHAPDAAVARFHGILTLDERARAARFHFSHLQHAFILARGALRILLGHYLSTAPDAIPLQYGLPGKPSLAEPARLRFNLSHSGGLALFAFTLDCEVGIDVEEIRELAEMEPIALRQFGAPQTAELILLPAGRREPAFFRCWTRMEAYRKALGQGLSASSSTTLAEAGGLTLHDLDVPPPYAAALAYRDEPRPLQVLPAVDAAGLFDGPLEELLKGPLAGSLDPG